MNLNTLSWMQILFTVAATNLACDCYAYTGLAGHNLNGILEPNPIFTGGNDITSPQNTSNLGSPLGRVGSGVEFLADFQDRFSQQWHLSADFQDNYQFTVAEASPWLYGGIGAGAWMVRWHFSGFDFQVSDVQLSAGPQYPWNDAVFSFDADDIWISFNHLYQDPTLGTYTFQITPSPVPEPMTCALCALGAVLFLKGRRRSSPGGRCPVN